MIWLMLRDLRVLLLWRCARNRFHYIYFPENVLVVFQILSSLEHQKEKMMSFDVKCLVLLALNI